MAKVLGKVHTLASMVSGVDTSTALGAALASALTAPQITRTRTGQFTRGYVLPRWETRHVDSLEMLADITTRRCGNA